LPLIADFAAAMAPLGPFEPAPHLAIAVSGGADSLALALLARDWAAGQGGCVTALVVDHGLRAASAGEAALTLARLAGQGIAARLLPLTDLARGPGLAERARAARYAALEDACRAAGILHLLLGHHAADQAETVAMRLLSGSGPAGLAGMAALVETGSVRLLRPLLRTPPARLRGLLRAAGLGWVEDPSNADPAATRARIRRLRADRAGAGPATRALGEAAAARGHARAARERWVADILARRARIHPEGFAVLTPGPIPPEALAALLRMLAGRPHPPPPRAVAALAASPRPATLGGVRLMPAGRHGPPGALLLLREAAAMAAPVLADRRWDGRFTVAGLIPPGAMLGSLGAGSAGCPDWPAAVTRTLPALSLNGVLFATPPIGYAGPAGRQAACCVPRPPAPACPGFFVPPLQGGAKTPPAAYVKHVPPERPVARA
jgi:tRNA(Ile)-lysidine synthase